MRSQISETKINFFRFEILNWYRENGRKFPWRLRGLTIYDYIIAEVLLQRTKAETISKFYSAFLKRFPNWESIVNSQPQEIENYLIPVGLYRQRSKRLISLANEMTKRNGVLPKKRIELETIPFMGQYIANAVELIIFNRKSPLIDINMSRVLERFFGQRTMADIRYDPYLQNLALQIVDHKKAKEINWGILDFAALICKPIKPLCQICALRTKCNLFKFYPKFK